jgi:hypothetical protein
MRDRLERGVSLEEVNQRLLEIKMGLPPLRVWHRCGDECRLGCVVPPFVQHTAT